LDECDTPIVRRKSLKEYRDFRRKCLEYIRGEAETSVMNQVHSLAWYAAVFGTLNEARRIESDRAINGALWELTTAGYASLMTLGIRKLVDKDPRTDSLWNVIDLIRKCPELLTREKFICYDGLPYNYESVQKRYIDSTDATTLGQARWLATKGPEAWATSEMMHRAFDRLSGSPSKRKREDKIQVSILNTLVDKLNHPAIAKVCTMVDQQIAHAERLPEDIRVLSVVTFNDISEALKQIVQVADFLSASFFYDVAFGAIVPTPQFNVLEALDSPWITSENMKHLYEYWRQVSSEMDNWTKDTSEVLNT
jgi:hypothetical protein